MEGTPLAVLEAGASGLPVVSTRHAGISDVVKPGETGYLVSEGDVDAMADFIYLLLSNPQMASDMGQKARMHICENFDVQRSTDRLRQILRDTSRKSH
jgi:glycosyltransferase involved in cell wall biosynthesis